MIQATLSLISFNQENLDEKVNAVIPAFLDFQAHSETTACPDCLVHLGKEAKSVWSVYLAKMDDQANLVDPDYLGELEIEVILA